MSKRRRLAPASGAWFAADGADTDTGPDPQTDTPRAPIARITGDAAQAAALADLAAELGAARGEGRMVLRLARASIVTDHLIRDRLALDPAALDELKASIRARGQQTPIEVVLLETGSDKAENAPAYGLISGWRRLLALDALAHETGDPAYGEVLALLRQPADQAQAYVAMVEENEIRAPLSLYERARVVHLALQAGVFKTQKQTLHSLFGNAAYAKRSKIKSMLPVVAAWDAVLRFPAAIPERTGLALARALDRRPGFAADLTAGLQQAAPQDPAAEAAVLATALRAEAGKTVSDKAKNTDTPVPPLPESYLIAPGLRYAGAPGRVTLEGAGINPGFLDRLKTWLQQGQS